MSELDQVIAENRTLRAEAALRAAELAFVNGIQQRIAAGAARDELGDEFELTDLGEELSKGKSESTRVFAVGG